MALTSRRLPSSTNNNTSGNGIGSGNANGASTARTKRSSVSSMTSMTSDEKTDDTSGEIPREAQAIIDMALILGIDHHSEFHLLPIAQHALEAPQHWLGTTSAAALSATIPSTSTSTIGSATPRTTTAATATGAATSTSVGITLSTPRPSLPSSSSSAPTTNTSSSSTSVAAASPSPAPGGSSAATPSTTTTATPAKPLSNNNYSVTSPLGSDLLWFRSLVESERARVAASPMEASPWLKLMDSVTGREYYFNFRTMRRADSLPRQRSHMETAKLDPADLEVMKFKSWWCEASNGERRYVHISYFISAEEFEINIDKDDKLYRVKTLNGKHGPMTCWDLHVQATLDIFGRPTTLMQCDAETRLWIESNARRLIKLRDGLERKLAKYERVQPSSAPPSSLAHTHLRSVMKQIARLKTNLAKYRPSLAAKYQI